MKYKKEKDGVIFVILYKWCPIMKRYVTTDTCKNCRYEEICDKIHQSRVL